MANTNEEILGFRVEANVTDALKMTSKFEKDMRRHLQAVSRAAKKMGKESVQATEDIEDANRSLIESVKELEEAEKAELGISQKLADLQEKREKATGKETAAIDEQIGSLLRVQKQLRVVHKEMLVKSKMSAWQKTLADPKEFRRTAKQLGKELQEGLKGGVRAFISKDAKGLAESLGGMLKSSVKLSGLGASFAGGAAAKKGAALKTAGAARGGMGGAAMKGMGGALGGIGKALSGLAKAAPLLGGLATILTKVVTMFIDAEAQAKAFNKGILQSASTIGFLTKAGGDTGLAMHDLEQTLRDVRDAAHDARTNLDWGITAETHQQVWNVLTQEGIAIDSVRKQADAAGKSMTDFSKEIVTSSVAWSRLIGVPLQEINQLQAEMVTDLGMGVQETQLAFSQMARTATESGIAANKFFSMIRGVSQDLSLWGSRMEDAVKLLGRLGKVMNPREAQKFLNTAMQGLKNMGRQERLRLTMLAGEGKAAKIIEKDTQRKAKKLGEAVGMSGDDLIKAMKDPKGFGEIGKKISEGVATGKIGEEQAGALRGAMSEMRQQMTAAGKGRFGTAIAARSLGPGAALEMMKSAMTRFAPKGMTKLRDMRGELGVEMMADNLGVSEEQLEQMVKFEDSMDMYREELKLRMSGLEDKAARGDATAVAELGKLREAGIKSAKDIDEAGYDDLMDTMDESTKKAMENQTKTSKDFAEQQSDLTQTLIDKLGVLIDFMMNEVYGILSDILSVIPGAGDAARRAKTMKSALASGDMELVEMLRKSSSLGDFQGKAIMETSVGKRTGAVLETGDDQLKAMRQKERELEAKWEASRGTEHEAGAKKELEDQVAKKDAFVGEFNSAIKSISSYLAKHQDATASSVTKILSEENIGKGAKQLSTEQRLAIGGGADIRSTLEESGLSEADIGKFFAKAMFRISPEQAGSVLAHQSKFAGAGAAPASSDQAGNKSLAATPAATTSPSPVASTTSPSPVATTTPSPAATTTSGTVGSMSPPKEVADFQGKMLDWQGELGGKNDDIIKVLKRSVKLDKTFVTSELGPEIEKSVLDAVRVALIEYKLYKDMDMGTFGKMLAKDEFDPKTFGKGLVAAGQLGISPEVLSAASTGNQAGGYIVGQMPDGTAKVLRPPAGEMPAYVGAGEAIVPKGGRGGGGTTNVAVTVNGIGGQDLARMVEVAATDVILKYKRREGLH